LVFLAARFLAAAIAALLAAALVAALATAPPATATAAPPRPPAAAGRLLVGFDHGVTHAHQARLLGAAQGRMMRRFTGVGGGRLVLVRTRGASSAAATDALRTRLRRTAGVAYAEPDYLLFASQIRTPNDPAYPRQWALTERPDGHDIHAPQAWLARTSCARVAILDTGIDTHHPDLLPNLSKSRDKPDNGRDDDHDGYVDDTYGYDAVTGRGSGQDDDGHGTHVAGIVAARSNNALGVAGTCWSSKLLPVKFMDKRGNGSIAALVDGLEYAVRQGVKIVNCSFGSTANASTLRQAVSYAQRHGVLLVVAAGNDGANVDKRPVYPAAYSNSNVLAVAATTETDELASFSDFGARSVDLGAPGQDILSTYLGGGYKVLSGTSMAAPYAAGVAALLRKQAPAATAADLRFAIRSTADPLPSLAGRVGSGGRLDAARALAAIGSLVR
jgi:subtilisin family serine protease